MKRVECEMEKLLKGKYLVGEYPYGVACAVAGCLWFCEHVETVDVVKATEHTEVTTRQSYMSKEHGICKKWKM